MKLKRSSVFLIVVMGLLATSGIALAGHEDSHAEDTQFSFGYDETNHILSLNIGPNWDPYVCDFEDDDGLTPTYGATDPDTGIIAITDLEDSEETKEFIARDEGLLDDVHVAEPDPADYGGTENVCVLSGVVVAGPNGQVNHGQFMKAAKSLLSGLFDGKGHGCLVRHLAQSNIGRTDDTRVRVSEVVDPVPGIVDDIAVIFSEAFEADCDRGKKNGNVEDESSRGGRPDSPGKSGDAPGHTKD
ncbi:MAG: hypothetical protein V3U46_00945 [Acidimicrobiia bacterium]